MTEKQQLRWGVIGCGDVVERKSGPSIEQAGRSRMVAVMRRDAAGARAFAERHGVSCWTTDADAVIGRTDVDIVYVATTPDAHERYVVAAAAAGKHVLVEKPMGLRVAEAERMIDACAAAGVRLFVAYYRRFQPHVEQMRALIAAGRIGRPVQGFIDIASAPAREPRPGDWRETPEISGGGRFVDTGVHRLDVMSYLLGDVAAVCGVASTFDPRCRVEQVVSLSIRFASGAQCAVCGDYYSGRRADRLGVYGAAGAILTDHLDGGAFRLEADGRREDFAHEPMNPPHLGLIRHVEAVLLDGAASRCSGEDGLVTERILDAAVRRRNG